MAAELNFSTGICDFDRKKLFFYSFLQLISCRIINYFKLEIHFKKSLIFSDQVLVSTFTWMFSSPVLNKVKDCGGGG